jgi:hypothetical protein
VGYFKDGSDGGRIHGFVRDADGSFETFVAPGADQTEALGISSTGAVTGNYGAGNATHGFVRDPDGTITTFDYPGAADTFPTSINSSGAIAGYYWGSNGAAGFLRTD